MKPDSRILAKRYARALCAVVKTGDLPSVITEMSALSAAIAKIPAFENPAVPPAAKKRALAGTAKNKILQNLLNIMTDNKRLALLKSAAEEAQNILDERTGTVKAEITFAKIPPDKKDLENILKKLFSAQKISAVYKEDKNIIGGIKIKAGDVLIDGSAANNLQKLKTALEA